MLRCPPSRITLTSTDLIDFEIRFNARQAARMPRNPSLRLSPGPNHHTRSAIVPEDCDPVQIRAVSSSSQATICSADDDHAIAEGLPVTFVSNSSGVWAVDRPSGVQTIVEQHPTPEQSASSNGGTLEGSVEREPVVAPARHHGRLKVSPSRLGLLPPGEVQTDTFPTGSPPRTEPRALSSVRARRRNARSHDIELHHDGPALQQLIESRHTRLPPAGRRYSPLLPPLVPELEWPHPALRPGAPVFVPHVRFGTLSRSSVEGPHPDAGREPQWGNVDSSHDSPYLRLQSFSEQNVELSPRRRINTSSSPNITVHPSHRQRSRASDQNAPAQQLAPNLERYPLLRPSSRHVLTRRDSITHRAVVLPSRYVARAAHLPANLVPQLISPSSRDMVQGLQQLDGTASGGPPIGDASPVLASSDRSTPTILHLAPPNARHLPDGTLFAGAFVVTTPARRVPSMVSAASGISDLLSSRPASSDDKLDAAVELMSMRSSPLDDLTEKLSRLSASRQRSVARSWERAPNNRPRVSLLNGDPFRQDPSPPHHSSPMPVGDPGRMKSGSAGRMHVGRNTTPTVADIAISGPVQITGILIQPPPLASTQSSSPSLPSTPPDFHPDRSTPRETISHRSPAKSEATPMSAVKRRPVPTVTATPKVNVYNDMEPANAQPQTPADVGASTRRKRGRSDTAMHPGVSGANRGAVGSAPTVPERHPHRNTYPSATPQQAIHAAPINATPAPFSIVGMESARRESVIRRAGTQRSSAESENDIEGHVQDLEQDRRTWLGRREAGSLDTTPPAVGRFERYLS